LSPRSGAIVIKDLASAIGFGGGPPTNLALSAGDERVIEDICADPVGGARSPQRGMAVVTPAGRIPFHTVTREAFLQVFQFSAGITTSPCDLVGAPLVATGRGFLTLTVNQLAGPGAGPGSFVVHATVHGIVELTAGGQARVHGIEQFIIRPDGTVVKDRELVTLTPL
jgi:hypothetical protein